MSILSNAEQIRVETITGANTALRVGGNLVEIANDLVVKQEAITANTAKAGITTGQTNAIIANTAKVGYTNTLVAAAPSVAANTAKVGITTGQASAITDNTSAILTKLGKSTSTIAVSEVDVLTAAAYTALATKVATKLYFTT